MSERALKILRWYSMIIGLLMLLPLVVVLLGSLNQGDTVWVPPENWGFEWYSAAFENSALVAAFEFSVETALLVAILAVVLGTMAGLAIARYRFPGRRLLTGFLLAPLLIPHVVLAIGLLQLFSQLGISSSPDGLVAGQVVVALPFVTRLVLVGAASIDDRLEKAALSLGASRARVFRSVVIPQIRPAFVSALVLAFLVAFDESVISVFTSTPGATTLPVTLIQYYESRSDPLIAAASSIVIVIVVVAILILDKFFGLLRLLSGGNFSV